LERIEMLKLNILIKKSYLNITLLFLSYVEEKFSRGHFKKYNKERRE